ncbi:MAG TPA: CpsB/CapC family capsule biosynthesis tyrosine phosphatase [Chondromyces sp.]|nr:CpsB/CapC family capsule biosynthesis tyrosine phosphatase [Chondromyces sp.]
MIDIHCHILPGVDDGAQTIEDSIAMAKQAESEGVRTIIATPHHKNGAYENVKDDIIALTNKVNQAFIKEGISVSVLPGQETRIYGEMLEEYENGELLTLTGNSPYLFVEFPSGYVPQYTEKLLFDLQMKGIIPVIVHPERNSEIMEQPDKLYKLVKNGAATQVTAASLAGKFGKKIQKFTQQLIEANLTHFIASDAHNVTNRAFNMEEAMRILHKQYGNDMAYYFIENAELLAAGKHIYKEPPQRVAKKKKFLGLF